VVTSQKEEQIYQDTASKELKMTTPSAPQLPPPSEESDEESPKQGPVQTSAAPIEIQLAEITTSADKYEPKTKVESMESSNQRGEDEPEYPTIDQARDTSKEGKRTWILSNKRANWRESEVVAERSDAIKVHYISYNDKFDEWIPKTSDRIRGTKEIKDLQKGDNLSAWYPKVHAWIEVEAQEIDRQNNRIKVIFVGTNDVAYMSMTSPNISLVHKNLHDPFSGDEKGEYEWVSVTVAEDEPSQEGEEGKTQVPDNTQNNLQQPPPAAAANNCCQIL